MNGWIITKWNDAFENDIEFDHQNQKGNFRTKCTFEKNKLL